MSHARKIRHGMFIAALFILSGLVSGCGVFVAAGGGYRDGYDHGRYYGRGYGPGYYGHGPYGRRY